MAVSMKQLLEAGVHFGHQTRKWNPKMGKYIYTARNDIHIINLEQTVGMVDKAYNFVKECVKQNKTVLFVGTKKQAQDVVKEEAIRCGMYYINSRWLGGTLTNFKTIKSRIDRMLKIEKMQELGEFDLLPKKEVIKLVAEKDKLEKNLGGIKEMTKLPGVIVVVDSKKEHICVKEARTLNIPLVGLIDTNCDPDEIDYVIPGNDDAIRSVKLIVSALADAVIEAKEGEQVTEKEGEKVVVEGNFEDVFKEVLVNTEIVAKEEDKDAPKKKKPVKKPTTKKEEEKKVVVEEKKEVEKEKKPRATKTKKTEVTE